MSQATDHNTLPRRCMLVRKVGASSATMTRELPAEQAFIGREIVIDGQTWVVRAVFCLSEKDLKSAH